MVDQVAQLGHLGVVLAGRVHRGPDRDHQLDAELLQLGHHGGRVGPLGRVELPVALPGPVEVVDDDHRQRQPAALVLARHAQQLVLGLVAELALPEPRRPLGQHRRAADRLAVGADQRGGLVRRGDPVVPLAGGSRTPTGWRSCRARPGRSRGGSTGSRSRGSRPGTGWTPRYCAGSARRPRPSGRAGRAGAGRARRSAPRRGPRRHLELVHAPARGLVPARRRPGEVRGGSRPGAPRRTGAGT